MYEWVKAFHIIAVIAWVAGMLYLPRLFVYHCVAEKGSAAPSHNHQPRDDCDLALGSLAGLARP